MTLTEILPVLRNWLNSITLPAQVLVDSEDCLRTIFETDHALAELIVAESEFAPFRFVSFTVLDSRLEIHANPVFCFHDHENSTIADILRELNFGIEFIESL